MVGSGSVDGRVVVVTGTAAPLGRGLAGALRSAGAQVHEAPGPLSDRPEAEAALADAAGALGPVDALVLTWVDPVAVEPMAFVDVDDERFEAVWEATMCSTRWWLQAAHGAMAGRGGRIVVVISTAALSGAPGLVAYTAAAEGQRLLAKSAARQWGPLGITVNCLAVAPELVVAGATVAGDVSLAPAALGRSGDPVEDLGPVLGFLVGESSHFLTGATLAADGGVWMSP